MTLEYSRGIDDRLEEEGYIPVANTEDGEIVYYKEPDVEMLRQTDPKKRRSLMRSLRKKERIYSESGHIWLPDFLATGRATVFVAGSPGVGKSYFVARCLETFPDNYSVMLFTALTEQDDNFRDLPQHIFRVRMTPEVLSRINLATLRQRTRNLILVFDDFDNMPKGKILSEVQRILHDALANGRAHSEDDGEDRNIHVFVTTHALNDYMKTKYLLENSNYVVLFPQGTTYCQLLRLGQKIGLSQAQMTEMKNSGERSIIIHKVPPLYVIEGPSIKTI